MEELDLHVQAHIADLVQKARAPLGFLKHPFFNYDRAGKGAAHMAEQFTFQQGFGERPTVHRHKGASGPQTVLVNGPRD